MTVKIDTQKNILVLGNGFDLHHNMKTKYSDYISFMERLKAKNENPNYMDEGQLKIHNLLTGDQKKIKEACLEAYVSQGYSEESIIKIEETLQNNFVQYFMSYHAEVKGWIDLEVLIKNITVDIEEMLDKLDKMATIKPGVKQDGECSEISWNVREILLAKCFNKIFDVPDSGKISIKKPFANELAGIDKKTVIRVLRREFDGLGESLGLYMKEIEPHYREIKKEFTYQQIEAIKADAVITFNYTDTYKRYGVEPSNVIYVHGSLEENNIVLGFNDDNERELDYVYFKKYMQCILKHTPILEQYDFSIRRNGLSASKPVMHFFGHSLDITDREKLLYLFESASSIKIYYYDEEDHEEKIERVIALLGKGKALEKIYDKTVDFVQIEKTTDERAAEKAERGKKKEEEESERKELMKGLSRQAFDRA